MIALLPFVGIAVAGLFLMVGAFFISVLQLLPGVFIKANGQAKRLIAFLKKPMMFPLLCFAVLVGFCGFTLTGYLAAKVMVTQANFVATPIPTSLSPWFAPIDLIIWIATCYTLLLFSYRAYARRSNHFGIVGKLIVAILFGFVAFTLTGFTFHILDRSLPTLYFFPLGAAQYDTPNWLALVNILLWSACLFIVLIIISPILQRSKRAGTTASVFSIVILSASIISSVYALPYITPQPETRYQCNKYWKYIDIIDNKQLVVTTGLNWKSPDYKMDGTYEVKDNLMKITFVNSAEKTIKNQFKLENDSLTAQGFTQCSMLKKSTL